MCIFIALCKQSAIITECVFYLQALSDLMMCILFHNNHHKHKLEYKEKIHLILLFVLYGLCIFEANFIQ